MLADTCAVATCQMFIVRLKVVVTVVVLVMNDAVAASLPQAAAKLTGLLDVYEWTDLSAVKYAFLAEVSAHNHGLTVLENVRIIGPRVTGRRLRCLLAAMER